MREEKRVRSWLKQAGCDRGAHSKALTSCSMRSIERAKIEMLATCEFVRRRKTIVLLGPARHGKTHLGDHEKAGAAGATTMHSYPRSRTRRPDRPGERVKTDRRDAAWTSSCAPSCQPGLWRGSSRPIRPSAAPRSWSQ
ncbi:ATP-binding protein [Mesorhizobium sp.]|uniref:ATP-binding protein n=1 Tax=Mesorhizobium sp. TaxID=1871066 RepID=UPI00341EB203